MSHHADVYESFESDTESSLGHGANNDIGIPDEPFTSYDEDMQDMQELDDYIAYLEVTSNTSNVDTEYTCYDNSLFCVGDLPDIELDE